jgi:hypothetical protein
VRVHCHLAVAGQLLVQRMHARQLRRRQATVGPQQPEREINFSRVRVSQKLYPCPGLRVVFGR